ncbi:MAG: hypothetical protein WBO10_03110 [Pyrinomonadaceae bacterium]
MAQSLKIIRIQPTLSRILIVAVALVCVLATWFSIKWHFASAVAPTFDRNLPESPLIAEMLLGIAPGDPQVHTAVAVTFERTFNAADLDRSLREYEFAVYTSPYDYTKWLGLGRARSVNGDAAGGETAFKRALELAPNYAAVHWAYGNFLVRQNRIAEGFGLIARAAGSDPEYARVAAVTALEIFDGNVDQALGALGASDASNAALQTALFASGRHDDAVNAWSRISDDGKQTKYLQSSEKLAADLIGLKKFGPAARALAFLRPAGEAPVAGQIANGEFESGLKMRGAGAFEWQIAEGSAPQIGMGENSPHAGKYDLAVIFNSFEAAAFRNISQTVVVIPGANYELRGYYKSDVKTAASLHWEVANAATTGTIAKSGSLVPAAVWTPITVKFAAPNDADGVIVRFTREGCSGPSCPTNGIISFDSFSIQRLDQ